jgi:MoxR-like ATPase
VLYGPPGTGKTWLARKLAQHLTDEGAVKLVQFHPSYTYEDFFEGYSAGSATRPRCRTGPCSRRGATSPITCWSSANDTSRWSGWG